MRKSLVAAAVLILAGVACPRRPAHPIYTIGVLQLIESPTIHEVLSGFRKALADRGVREGIDVRIDVRDGLGDLSEVQRIAQDFVADGVDMIVAVSTPCLQAAIIATPKIPIIFTSVANPYLTRAGSSATGHLENVTGVASTGPIRQTLAFVKEILPAAVRVGTLWTPSELNSEYYVELARDAAADLGLEIEAVPVANPNEVLLASQVLVNRSIDVIYQISDNTVNASFEALGKAAEENGIPLFGGFLSSTRLGAWAAMGWDFVDMGYRTGEIAVRIRNGESPARIPFQSMANVKLWLNLRAAARQNVRFSPDVIKRASQIEGQEGEAKPAASLR